jgi:uncharacterized surface protein with fasciclin (FAS1) repeats
MPTFTTFNNKIKMKQKQVTMRGKISVSSKSNKEATIVLVPKQRVLCIEKNEVKSINPKNTEDISKEVKPLSFPFPCYDSDDENQPQAFMTTDDGDVNIFNLDDVRPTTNNGKKSLELKVSTDDFESYGATAIKALSLDNLSNQEDVTIIFNVSTYPSLETVLNQLENFSILSRAVKAVDFSSDRALADLFSGQKEYTVLAPNDLAFEKLPDGAVQDLFKQDNKSELLGILLNHVFKGKLSVADIKKKKYLNTVSGTRLNVKVKEDGTVLVGSAKIVTPDVNILNITAHVINRVIRG